MKPDKNEQVVLVTIPDFDEIYFMRRFWAQNNDSELSLVKNNFVHQTDGAVVGNSLF